MLNEGIIPNVQSPVNIVLLFAEEDESWRIILLNHLSGLKSEGRITLWDIHQIRPGANREAAIEEQLKTASMILLLVSAVCLTSHEREIEQVLQRQASGKVLPMPILLHPVDWQNSRLSHLQPLPGNGVPITAHHNQDAAFVEVVTGIRRALLGIEHPATYTRPPTFPRVWNIP